ncbi:alpha,alpha-trehalose-phosphate synthase (UDP-forming) [Kitasatospora sp. CB01950]|uniref:alpha,alpha-trehalose-phosphate synthase (UDP-forming) n=1 Tax=Kitasatospora sp. CB01950 TaxID=1703930 RepID=UPI00093F5281|nr:trehalose-6-phosphate synthase [Kitasatospora sp. CB01950]OKJ11924.1 alpha,alpha-trehalose-phosphate synthase [Kitasatospora sp. CB01950]
MADHASERPTQSGAAPILVASNRGPVSFRTEDDGTLSLRRGGGGLVSGLSAIDDPNAVWVCAALSDADRTAARQAPDGRLDRAGHDVGGQAVRMLDIDPETFARAYNGVANSTLWFVHHLLYDIPTKPAFDADFRDEWAAYRAYNTAFAEALAAEAAPGAAVLVQDYHLSLAPALLRELRPDLRIGHFSHTPWAPPDYYRLLPDDIAADVLLGILGADRAAFLTRRWALAFADCCEAVLGASVDRDVLAVTHAGRTTRLGVHGLGADGEFLRERAHRPDVDERLAALREAVGDRRTIVRVDRTELSKNIVRGLLAYRHLLRTRPEWRDRVVHIAFAYPSRTDLVEYRDYTAAVQRIAEDINAEFGTADWQPLILHVNDDFPRSLAAYRLADVALVNPVRDGMNLVAKEVPVVSDNGCALVLSREAGAHAELADDAITVNPFDVIATADALALALAMPLTDRADRTKRLAAAATALPPQQWFLDQLNAL